MENYFRERLHNFEAKPPAEAWESIAAKLARRRRRRILWWIGASSAVLSLCALLWMSARHTDALRSGESASPQAASKSHTDGAEAVHATDFAAREKSRESGPSGTGRISEEPAMDRNAASASPAFGMTTTEIIAAPSGRPAPIANGTSLNDNETPVPHILAPKSVDAPHPALAPVPGALPMPAMSRLPLRPSSVISGSERSWAVVAATSNATDKPRKSKTARYCYDFERKSTAWMIDLYGGPALGLTDFRATDPEYDAYSRRRQNTEQDIVGFSAGMRLSRVFNRFLALRSGLNYERLTQRFSYVDKRYKRETYTTSTQFINGQWVTVTDTLVEFGIRSQTAYNRYQYLDIPLMIGMEMRGGRSGLSVQAGAAVNLLFMPEGVMLAPNNQTVGFNTGNNQIFKVRAGMSAVASAQCFYYLNPHLRAFAELAYRQPFAPITQSAYPVQQWQSSAALRLGFTRLME